jgi:hypothetical protein
MLLGQAGGGVRVEWCMRAAVGQALGAGLGRLGWRLPVLRRTVALPACPI